MKGLIDRVEVDHVADAADAHVALVEADAGGGVGKGGAEVAGERKLGVAVGRAHRHAGVQAHDRAAVVVDDLGVTDHRVVGLTAAGTTAGVGDAQVAGVQEAQVVEIPVHLGIHLVLFGQTLVGELGVRLGQGAAIEEFAGLVDLFVVVVIDTVGPPHRSVERQHVAELQERLISDVDAFGGERDLIVAAVAVDAGEREERVHIGDAVVAGEAGTTQRGTTFLDFFTAAAGDHRGGDGDADDHAQQAAP